MSEFHTSHDVKARKKHRCAECGDAIGAGELYRRHAGNYGGSFYAYKLCGLCQQAWRWTHSTFDPDPEWVGIGDLATFIEESAESVHHLRVAAYLRRSWRNRITGERYEFPEAAK